ncbi:PP2C family protein-serine/threonine phosphatase [Cupriavidus numazuensis]|uniref:Protein phosphatase PrpC n=1 Tax=Cupriavidus numazuensis TaxID=221992 RepID=A0ABN7Q5V0_9BURK|nr:protein phosphatase 2C domain-containing protein [Cupriavidus numazuensis]CAG2153905.1 Protein phosphatase PrpC [Cupriavidus numazuensis]
MNAPDASDDPTPLALPRVPRLRVACAMQSDTGCVRQHNEDAVGCMIPRDDDPLALAGALAVVADGMGGHAAGEVASHIALRSMLHVYYASAGPPPQALAAALVAANDAICERAGADPACKGMGTTCSVVAIVDDRAYVAHVGDSRIYLLRGTAFRQLTQDDSVVARMVRDGLLTEAEARRHPERHVLVRVLGTKEFRPAVAPRGMPLQHGDLLVLCTDGITDQIDDATLASVVRSHAPVDACTKLVELAREAGGADNATVAICSLQAEPLAAQPDPSIRTTRETRAH